MNFIYDLSEIDRVANSVISNLKSSLLLFYGEMGVGKTTLIKALAKALQVDETTSSPTFSLVNEYRTKDDKTIYHFDMYRLKDAEEALDMGLEHYLETGDYIFIEWPEKIERFLPEKRAEVNISQTTDGKRTLTLNNYVNLMLK